MTILWTAIVIQAIASGVCAGIVAGAKGRSGGEWFAMGFFFGIFGLIAAAGLPTTSKENPSLDTGSDEGMVRVCPDCLEQIRPAAVICPHCGHRFSEEEVVAEALAAMRSDNPAERVDAIETIAYRASGDAVTHLIPLLNDDDSPDVRTSAAMTLGELGAAEAVPELLALLCNETEDPQGYVEPKEAALRALIDLSPSSLEGELRPRLKDTTSRAVQIELIRLAGAAKVTGLVPDLLEHIMVDEPLGARVKQAIRSIGPSAISHLKDALGASKGGRRKVIEKLLAELETEQAAVGGNAARNDSESTLR